MLLLTLLPVSTSIIVIILPQCHASHPLDFISTSKEARFRIKCCGNISTVCTFTFHFSLIYAFSEAQPTPSQRITFIRNWVFKSMNNLLHFLNLYIFCCNCTVFPLFTALHSISFRMKVQYYHYGCMYNWVSSFSRECDVHVMRCDEINAIRISHSLSTRECKWM